MALVKLERCGLELPPPLARSSGLALDVLAAAVVALVLDVLAPVVGHILQQVGFMHVGVLGFMYS